MRLSPARLTVLAALAVLIPAPARAGRGARDTARAVAARAARVHVGEDLEVSRRPIRVDGDIAYRVIGTGYAVVVAGRPGAWEADRLHDFGRHNTPVTELAVDRDPRFRPSARLLELLKGNASLDRPLVPLLNALNARGIDTWATCAHSYLTVVGAGPERARVLQAIRPPWMTLSQHIGGWWQARAPETTSLGWWGARRTPSQVDAAFLRMAERVSRVSDRSQAAPDSGAVEWLRSIARRIRAAERLGYGPGWTVEHPESWLPEWKRENPDPNRGASIEQSSKGWKFELGFSGKEAWDAPRGRRGLVEIEAPTFAELQKAVDAELGRMLERPASHWR